MNDTKSLDSVVTIIGEIGLMKTRLNEIRKNKEALISILDKVRGVPFRGEEFASKIPEELSEKKGEVPIITLAAQMADISLKMYEEQEAFSMLLRELETHIG